MQAILSDIHANLEALNAVLADISQFPVTTIWCLGDTLGYGPNPRECLDLVRQFDTVLRGEVDDLIDPSSTHDVRTWTVATHNMVRWTQAELSQADAPQRWEFLRELKPSHSERGVLFVHGAPSNSLCGYLFPEDAYNPRKLTEEFSRFESLCFCGHSHLPGYFTRANTEESFQFAALEGDDIEFHLSGDPLICNEGSVGQPRDGDPRASYALYYDRAIRLRRVAYDWQTTLEKIRSNPDLNPA